MSKKKKNKGYALPALGVAGLGGSALSLHAIDRALTNAGLDRNLKVPKSTISALEDFAKLRVGDVAEPSMYFPEYVERANKAVNSRMFEGANPLIVGDALNESVISNTPKRLAENLKFLDRFGSVGKSLRKTIRELGYSLTDVYSNAADAITRAEAAGDVEALAKARLQKALASHIPGLTGSYEEAYLRLLNEMSGVSLDGRGNPRFAGRGKGRQLAEDLYEAVMNHTNPTRAGFKGEKAFSSASSYLDSLWHNTVREGGLQAVPGAYRPAANIAEQIIRENPGDKESAINALTEVLGGDKNIYSTLRRNYGTAARFGLLDAGEGKKILGRIADTQGLGKVTSKAKAFELGAKDLATAIFHGDATRLFTGSIMYHQNEARKVKALNILQKIRNPYLRAALGAGALGSAGVLTHRIIENRRKKGIFDKIKNIFS